MAKYDWNNLEKEYILGGHQSVSAFLKDKGIPNNGSTRIKTKGWKSKKQDKQDKIKAKTIQKVIEKKSEKDADNIVSINDVANKLLSEVLMASNDISDKSDIKKLTSALKDINDVLSSYESEEIEDTTETDLDIYG